MEDIPKTVEWLFAFANLGCKEGEPNLQSLDKIPILKRPPVKPLASIGNLTFEHSKPPLPHTALNTITDNTGYQWLRTWGEPVFIGKDVYPSLYEFKTFFTKNGLPPLKKIESIDIIFQENSHKLFLKQDKPGKNYIYKKIAIPKDDLSILNSETQSYQFLKAFWVVIRKAIICTIRKHNGEEAGFSVWELEDYIHKHYRQERGGIPFDRAGVFPHNNTFPCALYAHVLDWWFNHRRLHSWVRLCPCCGSFWIPDNMKKRGRAKVYCGKVCNDVFNKQSRHSNSRSASASKKARRNRRKKNDYNAIKEFFVKTGHSIEEAEIYANEWICDGGKTLESLKKEHGKR